MEDRQRYFSYLLRIWLVGSQVPPTWRASLENTHTGERLGFVSLEAMYQYLDQKTCFQSEKNRSVRKEENQ